MTKRITQTSRRGISRRQLLKATSGTAALLGRSKTEFPRRRVRARTLAPK